MEYEKRHVLFCDILGFTNAVKNKTITASNIYSIMQKLGEYIDSANVLVYDSHGASAIEESQSYTINPIAEHFSDCVVISVEATNLGAIWLCEVASQLQGIIVRKGFLCRGAITHGEMWHKQSTVFGPAYIEAVELEKKTELPRIAVSDNILQWFLSAENNEDYEIAKVRESQLIAFDEDGTMRVDPFSEVKKYSGNTQIPERITSMIDSWGNTIKSGVDHPDERIKKKYTWMASEYNKLIDGQNKATLPYNGYPSLTRSIVSF